MPDAGQSPDPRATVEARLTEVVSGFGNGSPALGLAMSQVVLSPCKRFRAVVLLLAGEATGGVSPALVDAACAVELVHAASLVFDDLPCMDDARTRRGAPAIHLIHGEGRAVLAGIALVTEAMRVLASARAADGGTRARLVELLAAALGPAGLSAGQDLDLHAPKDAAAVEREHDLKTGALFVAGFQMLAAVQRLDAVETDRLVRLGRILGRTFQSWDDLLDVQGTGASLGKDSGRDLLAPGPARGLLAVTSLAQAEAHYRAQREALQQQMARCGFDSLPLAEHVAQVLPVRADRAA